MIYEFMATQDLHGYGKPWAPGAGNNLFSFKDPEYSDTITGVTITTDYSECHIQGTNTSTGGVTPPTSSWFIELEPGTYTLKTKTSAGGNTGTYYRVRKNTSAGTPLIPESGTLTGFGFTVTEEDETLKLYITPGAYGTGSSTLFRPNVNWDGGVMIYEGSDNIPYEPFENICMPEGFNIWDPTNAEYIQVYAGFVNSNTRELYLRPVYQEYAGEELVGPWMSSLDEYSEDATPTEGAFVIDFGGELESFEITPFMLQTLLDSLGIRQHFTNGAGLLNSLMDQAQGRVRSEEELLHLSRPLKVIAIGDQLPAGITFKPISKDVLPGLPGKFIR